jgi:hypothetical protein
MTPTSYIENFCRVNDRRKALYKKLFDRYKQKSDSLLGLAADKEEVLDLQVIKLFVLIFTNTSLKLNQFFSLNCIEF